MGGEGRLGRKIVSGLAASVVVAGCANPPPPPESFRMPRVRTENPTVVPTRVTETPTPQEVILATPGSYVLSESDIFVLDVAGLQLRVDRAALNEISQRVTPNYRSDGPLSISYLTDLSGDTNTVIPIATGRLTSNQGVMTEVRKRQNANGTSFIILPFRGRIGEAMKDFQTETPVSQLYDRLGAMLSSDWTTVQKNKNAGRPSIVTLTHEETQLVADKKPFRVTHVDLSLFLKN